MLSPLQARIAVVLARLPEAEGFALAGGAALIVHEVISRETRDLDFFTPSASDVGTVLPGFQQALAREGLTATAEQVLEGFARLTVTDGTETTTVDLASDYRLRPPVETAVGRVVAEDELAADKVLALAGRVEARDYLDVARLVERHGSFEALCRLAEQKDPGFRRWALADMLRHFDRIARDDFPLRDEDYETLRRRVADWRLALERHVDRQAPEPPGLEL